jgi:hypothetical protein
MPRLYNKQSGALLGTVGDADIKVLVDQLEEEDLGDDDYFMDLDTVDILESAGASEALVKLLRDAIGDGEGIDIRWEK